MLDFKGKVVVITGAGNGIGRALAQLTGKQGAKVVVADINDKWGKQTCMLLKAAGVENMFVHHDVTKEESWANLAGEVKKGYGTVDYFFNNAGIMLRARPTFKCTVKDWQWLMDVNFWGVLYGLRTFTGIMMGQETGGLICTTCSTASLAPFSCWAPYTVSKAASLRLCETYQSEANYFKNDKVRYAAVMPGVVSTEISNCECNRPEEYRNEGEPLPPEQAPSQPGTPEGAALGAISPELCAERIVKQLGYGNFYIYTHRDLSAGLMVEQLDTMLLNKPITDQLVYDFGYYGHKVTREMTDVEKKAYEAAVAAKMAKGSATQPKGDTDKAKK